MKQTPQQLIDAFYAENGTLFPDAKDWRTVDTGGNEDEDGDNKENDE